MQPFIILKLSFKLNLKKQRKKNVNYWESPNKKVRNNRHKKINHQRRHPLSSYQGRSYANGNHQPKSYVTQNNNGDYGNKCENGYSRPTNFQNGTNHNNEYEKRFKNPTSRFMNNNNPSFCRICPRNQTFKEK